MLAAPAFDRGGVRRQGEQRSARNHARRPVLGTILPVKLWVCRLAVRRVYVALLIYVFVSVPDPLVTGPSAGLCADHCPRTSVTVLVSPPPALGAFHAEPHGGSAAAMHQSGQDIEALRHDDVRPQEQPAPRGVSRSIRPGVPAPATVLIVEMGGGALLLQGWRDGPSAYVSAEDAGPLRQALAAAYDSEHPVCDGVRS